MTDVIYIFLDESGDLGFKRESSKTFIVAYVITDNPHSLRTKVKRLRKRLKSLRRMKRIIISEFKFSRDSDEVRMKLFNLLRMMDFEIGYVVIDKNYVKSELRDKPTKIYNYITVHYIITNVLARYTPNKIIFTLDKSLSKIARKAYNNYFEDKLYWKALVEQGRIPPKYEVRHVDSRDDECIQIADYIAGAAFRKFEHNDPKYYNLIRDKIVFRNSWGVIEW